MSHQLRPQPQQLPLQKPQQQQHQQQQRPLPQPQQHQKRGKFNPRPHPKVVPPLKAKWPFSEPNWNK